MRGNLPDGFRAFRPKESDAYEITNLINSYYNAVGVSGNAVSEEVRESFCRTRKDGFRCKLVKGGTGAIVALGLIRPVPPEHELFRSRAYVSADSQHLGLGTFLESWMRYEVSKLSRDNSDNAQVLLQQRVIGGDSNAISFLIGSGYTLSRTVYRMEMKLTQGIPATQDQAGLEVHSFNLVSDYEEYVKLARSVDSENPEYTRRSLEEDLVRYRQGVLSSPDFESSLFIIARSSGTAVGYCIGRVSNAQSGNPIGMLVGLGVAETHRRQGIATHLLASILSEFTERGLQRVVLYVDGTNSSNAFHFYSSMGVRVAESYPEYQIEIDVS